eukprot:4144386-Karenia_brevis.AAC.1
MALLLGPLKAPPLPKFCSMQSAKRHMILRFLKLWPEAIKMILAASAGDMSSGCYRHREILVLYSNRDLGALRAKSANAPRVTRDLGLDYTGGNRRATGTIRKRVAQARIRAHR